jgi:hypothetical protein
MEAFYTPKEIAERLKLSTDKVIRLFEKEPGVTVIENRAMLGKRRYRTLRIPESVLERVLRRLSNPDLTPARRRRTLQAVGTASCRKQLTAPDHFSLHERPNGY